MKEYDPLIPVGGNYVRPSSIRWVEDLEHGLRFSLIGRDQVVYVDNENARVLRQYLSLHHWQTEDEEE